MKLKATLDQWLTLIEVERAGSIQAASVVLNKSHTTLIYAVKKLEAQLDVQMLRLEGRRSVLTEDAKVLLRRAAPMVEQARDLEVLSKHLSQGIEAEVTVTIDHLCDREWIFRPLQTFLSSNPMTSVQVRETSMSSSTAAVTEERADIAIVPLPIENYLAEAFATVSMIPVVARSHPLAQKATVCEEDLLSTTQIVTRDLGERESEHNVGWLKAQRRITVDNFDFALQAVIAGMGFCRIPDHRLAYHDTDHVVRLPLLGGERYQVPLHLVAPKRMRTGLAATELYGFLLADAKERLGD